MSNRKLIEWHFDFGLCATKSNQFIPDSKCDELLDIIIEWAEKNDYGIGGGYREFTEDEMKPFGIEDES
jgi:hypothetical protein